MLTNRLTNGKVLAVELNKTQLDKGNNMTNKVSTYRSAGLEARWGKDRKGRPFTFIFIRNSQAPHPHQRDTWWIVSRSMFETMAEVGIVEGFSWHTLLGDVFSIPA